MPLLRFGSAGHAQKKKTHTHTKVDGHEDLWTMRLRLDATVNRIRGFGKGEGGQS